MSCHPAGPLQVELRVLLASVLGTHLLALLQAHSSPQNVFQCYLHQPFPDQPGLPGRSWRGRRQRSWHDDPRHGRGGEEQAGSPSHGSSAFGASRCLPGSQDSSFPPAVEQVLLLLHDPQVITALYHHACQHFEQFVAYLWQICSRRTYGCQNVHW